MTVNIPLAGGVPGAGGPPDSFNAPQMGSYDLADVPWRGATKTTFGAGGSGGISFRAIQAVVGGQQYVYLSFRAAFVQALSDQYDTVYLGLQKAGGTKAMVIQMQVHGPTFTPAGPPSANPPANIASAQIWTRTDGDVSWGNPLPMSPSWIAQNARGWLQSATDVPSDPNNRWAIELRIPAMAAGDIAATSGPNLGTDFDMWYVIHGTTSTGSPVILADSRTAGSTTEGALQNGNFPIPFAPSGVWDEFLLTSGPAAFGGVSLEVGDVVVQNTAYGEGWTIDNGQSNTFVARPRNYVPGNTINAGDINATFRIANWGSVAGDPNQVNWASGVWNYVPGNNATKPVVSSLAIPPLAANTPPPNTNPIALTATMTLAANQSKHQCMLVTLSGTNLSFLNDSIFQNMDYDHASLLESEAEISIVGLTPFSPQPRDVYLAVEKVNMPRNTPSGTNEGRFLESSMGRIMAQGGVLADKLKHAHAMLSDVGDSGSGARLEELLGSLRRSLAEMKYGDAEHGPEALGELIAALSRWLQAVKQDEGAAKRLAALFDALTDWPSATGLDAAGKLVAFIAQLSQWLSALGDDPASSKLSPAVADALRAWLSTLVNGDKAAARIETLQGWLSADRPAAQLPAILNALRDLLSSLSGSSGDLRLAGAAFSSGVSRWLKGCERLGTFIKVLSRVGLTEDEIDQLFPTFRVHVYHDTGERLAGPDSKPHPVLRAQSSFGYYAYHEGALEGWQTSIQGAQRIADNLYLLAVPNDGTAKVEVRIQAVSPGDERIPEDKITPAEPEEPCGCLCQILRLFGIGKK